MLSWLQKTDGADGDFIKANRHPSGGNCFVLATPSGTKLAGGNGGGGAAHALKEGLAKWNQLAADEQRSLPSGKTVLPPEAARFAPPKGGLVLKSYLRNLKMIGGEVARITKEDLKERTLYPDWNPIYIEPAHYTVWLTETEWKSLIPPTPKVGDEFAV